MSLRLTLFSTLAAACSTPPARDPVPVDCAADDAYEFRDVGLTSFFAFGDETPNPTIFVGQGGNGSTAGALLSLETPRCESTQALHFYSSGHHDWGSAFGTIITPGAEPNGAGYRGLSFWAKSGERSDKTFTIELGDRHTHELGGLCKPPDAVLAPEEPPPSPEELCGNPFQVAVVVTRFWEFYTIPFDSFLQSPRPNVVPEGIDPSVIYELVLRVPRDTTVELWIDRLAWYRPAP